MRRTLLAFLLVGLPLTAAADRPSSFYSAKKVLDKTIYQGHQVTFYCGCDYAEAQNPNKPNKTRLTPDASTCGLEPRKNADRAGRIEWEHVVPAWEFGHQLQCWQEGGRRACRKDPRFKAMESDMMNLVPAVGELNGDRSNYRYGMVSGEPRAYGRCDFEVDFKQRVAEPPLQVRGDIARIYFYMSDTYGLKISRRQKQLFDVWNQQDPVDAWERERARRIAESIR